MKEYDFILDYPVYKGIWKTVQAPTYAEAVDKLTHEIKNGAIIRDFKETTIKYKYVVTITDVSLDNQGEWNFTFNDTHVILSTKKLSRIDLMYLVEELDIEIQADIDGVYEDGWTINDFTFSEVLYQEVGEV